MTKIVNKNDLWVEKFPPVQWFVLRAGQGFRSRYKNGFIRSVPAVTAGAQRSSKWISQNIDHW